jgi:outer membrane protein
MKSKTLLLTVLLSCLLSLISVCVYHAFYGRKIAYIELKKVFDGFHMKAELETKYKEVEKQKNKILDSLSFKLKIMSKHFNEIEDKTKIDKNELEQFGYRKEEFMGLQKQYQEENAVLSRKYDGQILERLTQYVIEFGKLHHYDIIFGAEGNGTLMYAREGINVSEDVIKFVNNKYKGID